MGAPGSLQHASEIQSPNSELARMSAVAIAAIDASRICLRPHRTVSA